METKDKHGLKLDFPVFLTISYSGMRVGELVALQLDDIDFYKHTIRINTYYKSKKYHHSVFVRHTLMVRSTGTIIVEEDVIHALKDLKASQEKDKKRLGDAYVDKI